MVEKARQAHVLSDEHFTFAEVSTKPVVVEFDEERVSSDAGAVVLKSIDERLGVSERLARCLRERRHVGKVDIRTRTTVPD